MTDRGEEGARPSPSFVHSAAYSPQPEVAALEGVVEVWEVEPESLSPRQLARCLEWLDACERAQHDRFVFERDRVLYRVAHAMLRDVLATYLASADIAFTLGPWGRPELTGFGHPPPLRFNLSHTRGLAAIVLTRTVDCGVDVERVEPLDDVFALADSVFAPAEVAALRRLSPPEQVERFYAHWTLKEAYIKARGMGLSLPLDRFAFSADERGHYTIAFDDGFDDPGGGWWFRRWRASEIHWGAVGVRGLCDPVLRRRRWPGP